jgi:asparagine synthase (glutamine-hydrolysing)
MRRALIGIVPDELIHRKRKAYTSCSPLHAIQEDRVSLLDLSQRMITDSLGIVNAGSFSKALKQAHLGLEVPIIPLMRTLTLEYWIRTAHNHGIFDVGRGCDDSQETLEPRSSQVLAG